MPLTIEMELHQPGAGAWAGQHSRNRPVLALTARIQFSRQLQLDAIALRGLAERVQDAMALR